MEKRTIELSKEKAKELYKAGGTSREVALQVYTEQELTHKPETWEEFSSEHDSNSVAGWFISAEGKIAYTEAGGGKYPHIHSSKEEAEAFLALMKLRKLRKVWVGDWEPNWRNDTPKFCITVEDKNLCVDWHQHYVSPLSFPTREMANEFVDYFVRLIEDAKMLL